MNFELHDLIGGLGVATMLLTYLFLQLNWMSAKSLKYSVLNGLGAGMILISLTQDFNKSAFVVEACWLIISVIGAIVSIRDMLRSRA